MSRPDEPITEPPPAGEDDAYSAATKVGVMSDELMAKLRAEGLLPDDPPGPPRPAPPRPSADPAGSRRSGSRAGTSAASNEAWAEDIPVIGSEPPPEGGGGATLTTPGAPPLPKIEATPGAVAPPSPVKVGAVETPTAFTSRDAAGADSPGSLSATAAGALFDEQRRGFSVSRRGGIVLAAVVVLAFVIAVLTYAR